MSDPTVPAGDLDGDLRRYFALTTSTHLPRRVAEMSARTLGSRTSPSGSWRRLVAALLAGTAGVAAAGLALFGLAHSGFHMGAGSSVYSSNGAAMAPADRYATPAAVVAYPGVDTARLPSRGIDLLPPAGHGTAAVSAADARSAAAAAAGAGSPSAGPAVLAFADLLDRTPTVSCLCWVVDVGAPTATAAPGAPISHTELVLVDAVTGRIVAVLSGNGIP